MSYCRVAAALTPAGFFSSLRRSRLPDSALDPRRGLPMPFVRRDRKACSLSSKALGNLLKMSVFKHRDSLSSLVPAALGWRCAGRMGKAMHPLLHNMAEALHQTRIFAFQLCQRLLLFHRYIAGLLQEAPTQLPALFGSCEKLCILFFCTTRLALSAGGEQRLFAMPPDIFDHMEMGCLKPSMRRDSVDRFGKAVGGIREGSRHLAAEVL